ncbi:hypothetical protein E2542_SST30879 [Spatholobus suberectus]|nr:hypothetical protein E2542_SST30879 [Spatholobus suberectus]
MHLLNLRKLSCVPFHNTCLISSLHPELIHSTCLSCGLRAVLHLYIEIKMGNSLRIDLDNSESPRFPCHIQLGRSVAVDLSASVDYKGLVEKRTVLYTVDGSTSDLSLSRTFDTHGNVKTVCFMLSDGMYLPLDCINLEIRRTETNIGLSVDACSITWTKTNSTVYPWGGVVETKVHSYGSGNRRGLIVSECKKNSTDGQYYSAATVAHYFAQSRGTAFNGSTEADIGFSVVVKFRASNGRLDTAVEGPEQHPASELFYMFDQVNKTGKWKPTMCPHCYSLRRGRMMFWQSDSEDSDSVLVPPRHGRQSARGIDNFGTFRGNGIGNFIDKNYMVFGGYDDHNNLM